MVEVPGSHDFKIIVLTDEWKYIFIANGGREQLFNRTKDPNELSNCVSSSSAIRSDLYALAVKACRFPGATDAIDGDKLRAFPFRQRPPIRIYQFDRSRGVVGFPDKPQDALKTFKWQWVHPIKRILASALNRATRSIALMSVRRKITT
jgi:choline-sulfatase